MQTSLIKSHEICFFTCKFHIYSFFFTREQKNTTSEKENKASGVCELYVSSQYECKRTDVKLTRKETRSSAW